MFVLFRRSFKTVIFSRFLKAAIATSNLINKVDNGEFASEFSVSLSKETIALVRDYAYETSSLIFQRSFKTLHITTSKNRVVNTKVELYNKNKM